MRKRILLLTGNPGVGKTTVLIKTAELLKQKGYHVGGMISREERKGSVRIGFQIIDLASTKMGWLAHTKQKTGPQIGKYRVNLEDLNTIGARAIANAVESCDVVIIDEIGPMELFSAEFKNATRKALESSKLVIAIVHWKAEDKLISEAKNREDSQIFVVNIENRDQMPAEIAEMTALV